MMSDLVAQLAEAPGLRAWTIGRELGRGGMGVVFAAVDPDGRQRAIKTMIPQAEVDDKARRLFDREVQNCLALVHPNVVRTFSSGEFEGGMFVTMELCEGGSLDRLVDETGPLDPDHAAAFAADLFTALAYAHESGLVHRDVKPHNLFLAGELGGWTGKLGDFGLAKAFSLAGMSGLTATGMAAGTPAFMPRQQILNYKYVKPDVDVWAGAATVYFALTGHPPRDFPPGRDPWRVVWDTRPVPIGDRRPDLPEAMRALVDGALVDDPAITTATATDLRDAFAGLAPSVP